MRSKAERLARELIALHGRYSARDFDAAAQLLSSGRLFEGVVIAAEAARPVPVAREIGDKVQKRRLVKVAGGPSHDAAEEPAEILAGLPGLEAADREELLAFAYRFADRKVLGQAGAIRSFAQGIGLSLPGKLPSRRTLLATFMQQLSRVPPAARARLLATANAPRGTESSLQGWSDLIVKR